jgi:acyl-CoA synthetase (AMP-forming)/AMP-acid ligase II
VSQANVTSHVQSLVEADRKLASAGSPFELRTEVVLGETLPVFAQRLPNIGALLDRAANFGDAEFLVFERGPRISFAEHDRLVVAVADGLHRRHGVTKGSRVGIFSANNLGWVLVAHACAKLGAVAVAYNSWWTAEELRHALAATSPLLVFADAKRRDTLDALTDLPPVLDCERVAEDLGSQDDVTAGAAGTNETAVDEDDPWLLIFTSGTSGRPKAAVLSHRSMIAFVQLNAYMGARGQVLRGGSDAAPAPTVCRLAVFPLFHISGMGSLAASLAFGHKTVWPAGRFDPQRVIELTKRERITLWGGASTHLARLLNHADVDSVGAQLLQVGIGGSASTPALIELSEARLPHLRGTFSSGYGMTECGGLATFASNVFLRWTPDCVGPALPTVQVKIVDDRGDEEPEGEVGTICIRSPLVMLEYWNNPTANSTALMPGRWLRTEDFGRLEAGILFLASRRRDLIIRGGENIYPGEIENALENHPDVLETAVFGVDDVEYGQVVHALVVVEPGSTLTAPELSDYLTAQLAYYKVPARIEIRSRPLPRSATGKVLKHLIESQTEHLAPAEPV